MISLINPHLVCHRGDSHSSGIPYLPIGLAYISACLEKANISHEVIDCFGEAPNTATSENDLLYLGLTERQLSKRLHPEMEAVVIYASSIFNSQAVFNIARMIGASHPGVPIILTENSQAVTGFSLLKTFDAINQTPATHVVLGESEQILPMLLPQLISNKTIPEQFEKYVWTVGTDTFGKTNAFVESLDSLPWPNWKQFPLENYWNLGYAHGPMSGKYVASLTSRGCPYPCGFCTVPVVNQQRWRKRSAENVVAEWKAMAQEYGVSEIHIEDVNPTIDEVRMNKISEILVQEKINLQWKIVSGTKLDNLKIETLGAMAKAGLTYISCSPESGSTEVLKQIRKPFRHDHAIEQIKFLRSQNVETQACFVLGYPGENNSHRQETFQYAKRLLNAGVGELAYFIISPMPGTPIENKIPGVYSTLSDLTFSPSWRSDYQTLIKWRNRMYISFFMHKIFRSPLRFFQPFYDPFAGIID